jgi:hypothetical protein
MTDKNTTEYFNKIKELKLSAEARVRMREELSSFADFHTVRIAEGTRSIEEIQRTSVFTLFKNSHLRIMKATLLIALMVGMGGTSLAAQGTIPGDLLYPIKVHVNETVRTAFAFDANQKAKLQLALLDERLEEGKRLASLGELHGQVETDLLARIALQVDKTASAANAADAEVGAEVRVAIADELSSFSNRIAIVPAHMQTRTTADSSVSMTAKNGDSRSSADVVTMSAFGTELAGEISVEDSVRQAQTRLEALQKTIRVAAEMSAEIKADFEAKLKRASDFIVEAQTQLKTNAKAQAETNVQKAHEILGEVESALSLMGEVQIDMNTGHIIGIDLSGSNSMGAGASGDQGSSIEFETETFIEGSSDASFESSVIDVDMQSESSVYGDLGL